MQTSGKNGNGNEPTTKPTEPTNVPTASDMLGMKLTVLNSLLAEFQSQRLISITRRQANGEAVYSINFPAGTWELEGGKFQLVEPTPANVPTAVNMEIPASV